jgi:hypothetical protein
MRRFFVRTLRALSLLFILTSCSACDGARVSPPAPEQEVAALAPEAPVAHDALASWNDGPSKRALVAFVERVTRLGGPEYVPPPERIAVFDNDGTLWSEQPVYNQLAFTIDRVKALAPEHPEWKERQPFQGVLQGDLKGALAGGHAALHDLLAATHTGNTTDEFDAAVSDWITSARHPTTKRLYTEMVYQPMLELLAYLRDNGFKTFIVSGGGADFMRPWSERVYGIVPEQVVGSRAKMKYEIRNGIPVLVRLPELAHFDDKGGKPVGIRELIGRRPIAAFGNSDGDFEMLEWTTAGRTPSFALIVDHTDGEREWAYRTTPIGGLEHALSEAPKRGWTVVDMARDWKRVFPYEP